MSRARTLVHFARRRWGRPFRSREALERHQRRMLHRQLRFLRRHSPGFRSTHGFGELPLSDKRTMMERFDETVTVPVTRDAALAAALEAERRREIGSVLPHGVAVGLSSGTSGHRGLFVTSAPERDAWAGTVLAWTLPPGRLTGHRIALVLRAGNPLYEAARSPAIDLRWFDLYDGIPDLVRGLGEYRPTILVAPPSVLRALAAHGLRLRPERVYSVAEVLGEADAATIADAFGQSVVHQLYQCTEGLLARTCRFGTLHLNEETVLVEREWIDDRRFVPIVTDLVRRSQPIVRYRLNDILVTRADPCPCGSVLAALERIEGREDDVLELDGQRVFADLVARAMVHASGFSEWRVTQTGASDLEVQLDDPAGEASVRAELGALWERIGVSAPALEFRTFHPEPGRKLRRVSRDTGTREGASPGAAPPDAASESERRRA